MKPLTKYIAIGALALVGGFVFYNKVYIPKSTYEKVNLSRGEMKLEVFGIGNVGAKNIYNINSSTGGRVITVATDEGRWVKKGDMLAQIDSVDLPLLIQQAKVGVEKAQSELRASLQELESLQAQKSLALVTYKRYEKLKELSFASQAEYDKAKADLDVVIAQIAATQAHIVSAKVEVKRLKKGVEALEEKLARFTLYAPVDGLVIEKDVALDQSVLPSQTLFKIVDTQDVWVRAYIDEKISGDIKVGQHATIVLRSQKHKKFDGVVGRIVAQSDAITGEREVDVYFKKLPIPFYINEQAEVNIATKTLKNIDPQYPEPEEGLDDVVVV